MSHLVTLMRLPFVLWRNFRSRVLDKLVEYSISTRLIIFVGWCVVGALLLFPDKLRPNSTKKAAPESSSEAPKVGVSVSNSPGAVTSNNQTGGVTAGSIGTIVNNYHGQDAAAVAAEVVKQLNERANGIDPELKRRFPQGYGIIGITKRKEIIPIKDAFGGQVSIDWKTALVDMTAQSILVTVPTMFLDGNLYHNNGVYLRREVGAKYDLLRLPTRKAALSFELVDSSAHGEVVVMAFTPSPDAKR